MRCCIISLQNGNICGIKPFEANKEFINVWHFSSISGTCAHIKIKTKTYMSAAKILVLQVTLQLGAQWLSGRVLVRDRRAAGSSLTGVTALLSLSKTHLS